MSTEKQAKRLTRSALIRKISIQELFWSCLTLALILAFYFLPFCQIETTELFQASNVPDWLQERMSDGTDILKVSFFDICRGILPLRIRFDFNILKLAFYVVGCGLPAVSCIINIAGSVSRLFHLRKKDKKWEKITVVQELFTEPNIVNNMPLILITIVYTFGFFISSAFTESGGIFLPNYFSPDNKLLCMGIHFLMSVCILSFGEKTGKTKGKYRKAVMESYTNGTDFFLE